MRNTKQMVLISLLITVMGCCHGKPDEQKEVATKFRLPDLGGVLRSFPGKRNGTSSGLLRDK